MALFLTVLSGFCWTLAYIFSIRTGFKDQAGTMPFAALALNITWEGLYTITGLTDSLGNVQFWINLVWVAFDLILLYIYLKYAKEEFSTAIPGKYFLPWTIFLLIMSGAIQFAFMKGFGMASGDLGPVGNIIDTHLGVWYSAFIQNLIMSVLYIAMFIRRGGTKGQSLYIAVSKWIGTFAPTILFGFIFQNHVIMVLGTATFILDVSYIWMLVKGEHFFDDIKTEISK